MSSWYVEEPYKFAPNGDTAGEYILNTTLAIGDEVKVVRAEGTKILTWYPGGMNNYIVDYAHSGSVNVYFRPAGNSDWYSFFNGGFFYISKLHTVTVVTDGHGEATLNPTAPDYTATVYVTATPNDGYHYDRVELYQKVGAGENDLELITLDWNEANKTFTMPDFDVVIKVYFAEHVYGTPTYEWAADNSTVTATHVCSVCGHEETETANVTTAVTTAAGCETTGVKTYTATFTNTAFATQTKTEEIPATGHAWGTPTYTWAANNSTVTATRVCANDASHVETETVDVAIQVTAATCTTAGSKTYTATFTNEAFETQTKTEEIPALGHAWGEPTYEWSPDNSKVAAKRVCANDPSHVEEEKVNTTVTETAATCETAGSRTYTATFTNEAFETQTKTEEIPAIGHAWGEPTYVWAEDNSSAMATAICANDPSHKQTETVNTTYAVITEATAEEAGVGRYTATFTKEPFTTQTKDVEIPATGHNFGAPTYEWAADNSTVTATRTCTDAGCGKTETETVNTSVAEVAATCTTAGSRTYTATFTNEAFETQTKTEEIPAFGHAWGAPTYEWAADNSTVTAKRVCANDPSHVETETVDVAIQVTDATCETAGSKTYTATFANEAFETQTKTEEIPAAGHKPGEPVEENRVEATCLTDGGYDTVVYCTVCHKELSREHTVLPATGHAWDEPTYEWAADNSTVTAKRVCANDPTHIESETVDTSYEVTKPATTEEEGTGLYTATFENEAFETQTREIVLPKITKLATEIRINEADVEYKGTTPYVVWNHVRHEPGFTVVAEDGTVLTEADYTYEYRENDKPGTGYIFVTVTNEAYADPNYAYFKIYLEPTEWMTIANVSDGIRLEWAPVQDAAGYVIYRRAWNLVDGGWTTFERWDNTTETTWLDGHDDAHKVYAGTRYQYGVKAYFTRRTDPVINQQIGGNVGDNYNLGLVGPLKTTVRITTRTLKSVTPGTKQLTVKWGGSKVFTGYQIKYATDENFTKGVRSIKIDDPSTTQKVITGLVSGKTYYVMVRSYQEFEGMTYFGEWSNVLSAKIK